MDTSSKQEAVEQAKMLVDNKLTEDEIIAVLGPRRFDVSSSLNELLNLVSLKKKEEEEGGGQKGEELPKDTNAQVTVPSKETGKEVLVQHETQKEGAVGGSSQFPKSLPEKDDIVFSIMDSDEEDLSSFIVEEDAEDVKTKDQSAVVPEPDDIAFEDTSSEEGDMELALTGDKEKITAKEMKKSAPDKSGKGASSEFPTLESSFELPTPNGSLEREERGTKIPQEISSPVFIIESGSEEDTTPAMSADAHNSSISAQRRRKITTTYTRGEKVLEVNTLTQLEPPTMSDVLKANTSSRQQEKAKAGDGGARKSTGKSMTLRTLMKSSEMWKVSSTDEEEEEEEEEEATNAAGSSTLEDLLSFYPPDKTAIKNSCAISGVPAEYRAQVWKILLGMNTKFAEPAESGIAMAAEEEGTMSEEIAEVCAAQVNTRDKVPKKEENPEWLSSEGYGHRTVALGFERGTREHKLLCLVVAKLAQRQTEESKATLGSSGGGVFWLTDFVQLAAPFVHVIANSASDATAPFTTSQVAVACECVNVLLPAYIPWFHAEPGVRRAMLELFRLLAVYHDQEVAARFGRMEGDSSPVSILMRWVRTLFASCCSMSALLVLWDFLFISSDPFMAFFFALAILLRQRKRVLQVRGDNKQALFDAVASVTLRTERDAREVVALAVLLEGSTPRDSFRSQLYHIVYHTSRFDEIAAYVVGTGTTKRSAGAGHTGSSDSQEAHHQSRKWKKEEGGGEPEETEGEVTGSLMTPGVTTGTGDDSNRRAADVRPLLMSPCLRVMATEVTASVFASVTSGNSTRRQSSSPSLSGEPWLNFFVFDSRDPEDFDAGHLPTATSLPARWLQEQPEAFMNQMETLVPLKGTTVEGLHFAVMGYDRRDPWTGLVAAQFLNKGFNHVSVVHGGYADLHQLAAPYFPSSSSVTTASPSLLDQYGRSQQHNREPPKHKHQKEEEGSPSAGRGPRIELSDHDPQVCKLCMSRHSSGDAAAASSSSLGLGTLSSSAGGGAETSSALGKGLRQTGRVVVGAGDVINERFAGIVSRLRTAASDIVKTASISIPEEEEEEEREEEKETEQQKKQQKGDKKRERETEEKRKADRTEASGGAVARFFSIDDEEEDEKQASTTSISDGAPHQSATATGASPPSTTGGGAAMLMSHQLSLFASVIRPWKETTQAADSSRQQHARDATINGPEGQTKQRQGSDSPGGVSAAKAAVQWLSTPLKRLASELAISGAAVGAPYDRLFDVIANNKDWIFFACSKWTTYRGVVLEEARWAPWYLSVSLEHVLQLEVSEERDAFVRLHSGTHVGDIRAITKNKRAKDVLTFKYTKRPKLVEELLFGNIHQTAETGKGEKGKEPDDDNKRGRAEGVQTKRQEREARKSERQEQKGKEPPSSLSSPEVMLERFKIQEPEKFFEAVKNATKRWLLRQAVERKAYKVTGTTATNEEDSSSAASSIDSTV